MTTAMTDVVRSIAGSETFNVHGDAYMMSVIIHVRWGLLALPVASVTMAILLHLARAILNSKYQTILWKASALPLLLGEIQTRPEHDLAALPRHIDQIVDMTK
ncbi:hypothetical protein PENSUB_9186 [Penicillium subrubescens]|uniref:Uncharacterized protein n=1 Tax=Penicillium subrubescens TaxID=1316194 RepID=A0A1Q5TE68_9EURO|nr:hypothetical protein PENSUB_9186 [Penicillium subrubescens]